MYIVMLLSQGDTKRLGTYSKQIMDKSYTVLLIILMIYLKFSDYAPFFLYKTQHVQERADCKKTLKTG